jgi:hypothetical protein
MEKYRPSNGSEGECFFESWCRQCARDRSMREGEPIEECDDDELCDIIARSYRGDVDEWVYGPDGEPMCTAFVPAGQPIPPPKDDRTPDMFGDVELNDAIDEAVRKYAEARG